MSPERRSGGLNAFCRFVYMCSIIPGKSKPLLSLTSTVAIRESFGTIVCNYPSINTVFASGCKKDENVAWFFFFFLLLHSRPSSLLLYGRATTTNLHFFPKKQGPL